MRPRDIINRSKKKYFLVVAISFAIMAVTAYSEKFLPETFYVVISIGAISVFFTGVLLVYIGIKCPKCNAILGLKYVYAEETLKQCPKCRIVFDDDSM